jgi:ABC-type multidrug transport system permease subunit
LSSSEISGAAVRLGFLEHAAANPWRIVVTADWPRAVLQCFFFTLLGTVTGGPEGGRFAFVGSLAMIMTLDTIIGVADVPALDKWVGTFYRLQLSGASPAGIFALRSIPWVVRAVITMVSCLVIVGPATGNVDLSLSLVPVLPLFVLMAVTTAAAGLAAASPAIGRRADVVVTNGLTYLLIAAGGLLVPAGRAPLLDVVGYVLPLRHGVFAIRDYLEGRPWLGEAALELLVGLGWALLAVWLYRRQSARARITGSDDFA